MIFSQEQAQQSRQKRSQLAWFDVLILTIIFWGEAIYSSTMYYLYLMQGTTSIEENLVFTVADNYNALATQVVTLFIAIAYLLLRHFDFKTWNVSITPKAVGYGILIFIFSAILMDVFFLITGPFAKFLPFPGPIGAFFGNATVSRVIYALFNGVYEEIYFLGICLAVAPKAMKWAIPFSLLIRISFHTYQGMLSALAIGLLFGGFLYLLYRRSKDKNLVPFFVAHAIADVTGLGILGFLTFFQ